MDPPIRAHFTAWLAVLLQKKWIVILNDRPKKKEKGLKRENFQKIPTGMIADQQKNHFLIKSSA